MLSLLYTYIPNAVFLNDVVMLPHALDGGEDAHAIQMCKLRTMQSSQAGRGIIWIIFNNVMHASCAGDIGVVNQSIVFVVLGANRLSTASNVSVMSDIAHSMHVNEQLQNLA